MVSKAAFYRDRAGECALRAAEATAPDIKKSYEDLEAQWRRLAGVWAAVTPPPLCKPHLSPHGTAAASAALGNCNLGTEDESIPP